MDIVLMTQKAVDKTLLGIGNGAFGFGIGWIAGKIVKSNPIQFGVIFGIGAIAKYALDELASSLGRRAGLQKSQISLIHACNSVVVASAEAAALFTHGLLGPVGIGVCVGLAVLGFAFNVGHAASQRQKELQRAAG